MLHAQAATMEAAMADLAAQNLPHDQAQAAADAILQRFMPDAFAALQPGAAAAHAAPAHCPAQPASRSAAESLARPRLSSAAAAAPQPRSGAVATPRKRLQGLTPASPKPPVAPRKRQRTVSRVAAPYPSPRCEVQHSPDDGSVFRQ